MHNTIIIIDFEWKIQNLITTKNVQKIYLQNQQYPSF